MTDFAIDIVKANCLLHNIVRERDGLNYEENVVNDLDIIRLNDVERQPNIRGGRQANEIRNAYADYFTSSEGSIP